MKARKLFAPQAAAGEDEGEILLYDVIGGWWGISAEAFRKELATLGTETVHVRINSPGGDAFEGAAIYNALREYDGRVITHVDGLAASMASVIALAGEEVRMARTAFYMIHEPWSAQMGKASDLRKTADLLDKVSDAVLVNTYQRKTGTKAEQIREWMAEETWFSGAEAKDAGFVDVLTDADEEEEDAVASAAALFDLSIFSHVPDSLVALAGSGERRPTERQIQRVLQQLGLSRTEARQMASAERGAQEQVVPADGSEGSRQVVPATGAKTGRSIALANMQLQPR